MELASGSIHLVTNRVLKIYGGDLAIGAMTTITSIYLIIFNACIWIRSRDVNYNYI